MQTTTPTAHIAIVGAGWAGCAAAVHARQMGARVTLLEASRTAGGRARSVPCADAPDGVLDNGQHILIGAYSQTLELMRAVNAAPHELLQRLPLDLRTPDGCGLHLLPAASARLAALRAIICAKGWSWGEKLRLLCAAAQWQMQGFRCPSHDSVADLCKSLGPAVYQSLIEPLCVAAFNSAPHETSGAVFLRVLQDALFSSQGASDALIALAPLGKLLPEPAVAWLQAQDCRVHLGNRVLGLQPAGQGWQLHCSQHLDESAFDHVILACPAPEAARLVQEAGQRNHLPSGTASHMRQWVQQATALRHVPIATLYAWCPAQACAHLPPMQALTCASRNEAQFVFHHAQLQRTVGHAPQALLAFVASHCDDERQALEAGILVQAHKQLGLPALHVIRTAMEKRATFVCSPALERPAMHIAKGLSACGDYVHGPYPATLEGAVRSGLEAAARACSNRAGIDDRQDIGT